MFSAKKNIKQIFVFNSNIFINKNASDSLEFDERYNDVV